MLTERYDKFGNDHEKFLEEKYYGQICPKLFVIYKSSNRQYDKEAIISMRKVLREALWLKFTDLVHENTVPKAFNLSQGKSNFENKNS